MLCHSYIFFDKEPSIRELGADALKKSKAEFVSVLEKSTASKKIRSLSYSTLGLKADNRFALYFEAESVDKIQDTVKELVHTSLGAHLKITYTLFGMVRSSQYGKKPAATGAPSTTPEPLPVPTSSSEPEGLAGTKKYLVVYPFTKTESWYAMSFDERREMMKEHVGVGRKFNSIDQLLLYAFGVDDHEFIVSYETDSLFDFQTLVMELRTTKGRIYTKNDLPIFTCIRKELADALDTI